MDRALYVAMSGAKNNMISQASHSNNLANARTTAFKSDFAQARSMPVWGEHFPTRAYALTERPGSDFNDGPLVETGNDLDLAIEGDGMFGVVDQLGNEAYSRRGDLTVTALGELINGDGLQMVGDGGPIVLPEFEKLHVGEDGIISIRPPGAGPEALVVVDQIKLVNPELNAMEKGTDGLFRVIDNNQQVLPADPALRVVSGFTEGSNVNAVNELTHILALTRQYEIQIKMMKTSEDVSKSSEQILRIS